MMLKSLAGRSAAGLGISGRALVDAVIDKTGKVRDAHTVRSAPALDRAARG